MIRLRILEFTQKYEQQATSLIVGIQSGEFGVKITAADQPDLTNIKVYYQTGHGNFWIALINDKVVGTISLFDIDNQQLALRKMFVNQDFRGKPLCIGQKLMDTAFDWSKQKNIKQIFLGTVPNYYAAHRFYEKNNFMRIKESELPVNFQIMQVDKYFYRLEIT